MQARAPERRERVRQAGRARTRPRPAQDRPFERRDGAGVSALGLAEAEQRMLEQRQQGHRREGGGGPPSAAPATSRVNRPAGVSPSASPPESSTATSQRARAAITRRASARSG